MKFAFAALVAFVLFSANARDVISLDDHWRFLKADAPGAEQPRYDDSKWRTVTVPHDWSIEGPFAETNRTGGGGGFLPSGVAWYRKSFTLPAEALDRRVFVEFDGVMRNSDVWINGVHLGHRPNGYVSFRYELPAIALNFGGGTANMLAVCADTSVQPASRWYSGAGIYRHVRLVLTDSVHVATDGVFVTTPEMSASQATVKVLINVTNESSASHPIILQSTLIAPNGEVVGAVQTSKEISPGDNEQVEQQLTVSQPQPWTLDRPQLYRAVTEIRAGGKIFDAVTTPFGIRQAEFRADTGFWLNGKNFKIKGVCLHADGGAFGAAVPLSIWEARLKTLKSLGVNAIRTAHNPPAPEFLDLCDCMGLLVMDELFDCWTTGKESLAREPLADYHLYFNDWSQLDAADTVRRDRNHPSVILYSAGNEIHDTTQPEKAKKILAGLIAVFHENDPSRPVTQGLFRPNVSGDYTNGLADLLDVVGQNYREQEILAAHEQKPSRKILGTENTHARQQWVAMRDSAPYAGQFLWTGVDYLGETRRWPLVAHGSGLLDRTGAPRAVAFERQSWWGDRPMVFACRRVAKDDAMPADPGYAADELYSQVLFTDWTPKNSQPHSENVEVYSNCKQVELFLNGKSLGKKEVNADASPLNWDVPFAPGILKAVGRNGDGRPAATNELHTASPPFKIVLTTETQKLAPGFDNVAIIRAKIVDRKGNRVPRARDRISFSISGPGIIAAVDNADNSSHDLFQTNSRPAFQGECVAFVKVTANSGKIRVTASAAGLKSGSVVLKATPQ